MRGRVCWVVAGLVVALGLAGPAEAKPPKAPEPAVADCNLPESNAEALEILNSSYPNKYVWDHTHLTVAVQAANVSAAHKAAVRGAITTWNDVLVECFGGRITLTDVTGSKRSAADIVVHYVPHAGGGAVVVVVV